MAHTFKTPLEAARRVVEILTMPGLYAYSIEGLREQDEIEREHSYNDICRALIAAHASLTEAFLNVASQMTDIEQLMSDREQLLKEVQQLKEALLKPSPHIP